jgi:SHS2 domain-containing protein
MPYELSDKHTTGDAGITASGKTLGELFEHSAYGLMEIMVDPAGLNDSNELRISLEDDDIEQLYYSWLSDLIYYKDTDGFLAKKCDVKIFQNNKYKLEAVLYGDKINPARHLLKIDVKGVTLYRFKIEKTGNLWKSEVVFDL